MVRITARVSGMVIGAVAAAAAAGTIASAAPEAAVGAAVKAPGQTCRATGYEPALHRSDFQRVIDNPYYPLPVGRVLTYTGIKDGVSQVDVVKVTSATKILEGIPAVTITDVATHHGRLLEKTTDWYAQDKQGNVWYLGEATAAYSHGHVDHSGSWQAGVNDAEPGIIMKSSPQVLDSYRQECLPGVAEDTAWTVVKGGTFQVPSGTVHNVLTSLEFTRIEPTVIDKKVYAPGIGIVFEEAAAGPKEVARLVSVHGG